MPSRFSVIVSLAVYAMLIAPFMAEATPFATCPSKAFLVQTSTAKIYGVNLVTGNSPLLEDDMNTSGKLNAMGFSVHDQYLYAWSYEHQTLAQIGSDFQVMPLPVANIPSKPFYVGDVSVLENKYYMYRPERGFGLYSIDLNPDSPDHLTVIKQFDSVQISLNIYDLAFHPNEIYAYSVDSRGDLQQIDVQNGTVVNRGFVGERGTFGAVYFDVEGNFYISRNNDGNIFRIDVAASTPTAELFASGPASSNNDGARCATAPLIDEDDQTIDFGDAPDSYGTTLSNNGARHEIVSDGLFLGKRIDGEPQAFAFPNSDDQITSADEDGVAFLTSIEAGLDTVLQIEASQPGILNAWLDANGNGVFDDEERVIDNIPVTAGYTRTRMSVPATAQIGDTWMRFRLSNETDLAPTGGIFDGEVEDYQVYISANSLTTSYYPSRNNWITLAYEDNWPAAGDYDVNDVVVKLRATTWSDNTSIRKLRIEGQVVAVGASYHNGFGIRLPNIDIATIDSESMLFYRGNTQIETSPVESNRSELIIIVTEDVWDLVTPQAGCKYFNTESGCYSSDYGSFYVDFQLPTNSVNADFSIDRIDPFIFATPNRYHGPLLNNPGRSWEVHLKNQSPTEAFDTSLWQLADDASAPASGYYYQSANGMPWAFQINDSWAHPKEHIDLLNAYPQFKDFVESSGTQSQQWFIKQNANPNNIVD